MSLFTRSRPAGPTATEVDGWRGRAATLPDAGPLHWQALMAALEVGPVQPDDETMFGFSALGLAEDRLLGRVDAGLGVRLHGTRHDRQVDIRIGLRDHGFGGAAMVTWLRVESPEWTGAATRSGFLAPDPSAPAYVAGVLGAVADNRISWGGLQLRGGAEGIVAHRTMTGSTNHVGYLYDLWLLERIAAAGHLAPLTPMPEHTIATHKVPYRLG